MKRMLPRTIRSKITAWTCNLCCNLWSFGAYSLFKVVWLGLYTLKPVWLRRKSSKIRFSGGINGFGHCDHKPYLTTLLKNEFGSSATLGSGYLVPLSRPKLPNPRRRAGPKLIFRWYGLWCMAQTKLIAPVGCSGEVFVHFAAKKPHTCLGLQVLSEFPSSVFSLRSDFRGHSMGLAIVIINRI